MELIGQINEAAGKNLRGILFAGFLTGVANTAIIAFVNAAAASPQGRSLRPFCMFSLSILLYVSCYRYSSRHLTTIFEDMLYKIKVRITDKLRRIELQGLEQIGTSEIYDRVTENMGVISESSRPLANLLRSVFMVALGAIYMILISFPLFLLMLILFAGFISLFATHRKQVSGYLRESAQRRLAFLERLTDLLQGFKEVKFSQRRSDDLQRATAAAAGEVRASTLKANLLIQESLLAPDLNCFALLGLIVFIAPIYFPMDAETTGALVALGMFIFYPISGVVTGVPALMRANLALQNVTKLEHKLDDNTISENVVAAAQLGRPFKVIKVHGLAFRYAQTEGQAQFSIGPLSLTISAGEVLFIVGGNGSGKSTLLKVLTGIYPLSGGTLELDGVRIHKDNVQAYREMISAIFSDFYLFRKLYGLNGVADESVRQLLASMQLKGKTAFGEHGFTSLNLSTGQRKRLALVVTLLEDRPIYAFDEWAADQDPEFRRYFYEELIPELRRRGKTVLVVTHDDRYFHCADRVITMEYGKLR